MVVLGRWWYAVHRFIYISFFTCRSYPDTIFISAEAQLPITSLCIHLRSNLLFPQEVRIKYADCFSTTTNSMYPHKASPPCAKNNATLSVPGRYFFILVLPVAHLNSSVVVELSTIWDENVYSSSRKGTRIHMLHPAFFHPLSLGR